MSSFLITVLALLAAPGPSNTLLTVAGAQGGKPLVLRLLPVLLLAYLAVIVPVSMVGEQLTQSLPLLSLALKAAAAIWVMVMAVKLWRGAAKAAEAKITAGGLLMTTLLNPKSLVVGLILMPKPQEPLYLNHLFALSGIILVVGAAWGLAGSLLPKLPKGSAVLYGFTRLAAVWLGLISLALMSSLLGATGWLA